MNYRALIPLTALALFFAYTVYVIVAGDMRFSAWVGALRIDSWNAQISIDLYICVTLISIWMFRDARSRGKSAVPFIVLSYLLASMGPLLYLTVRNWGAPSANEP